MVTWSQLVSMWYQSQILSIWSA